MQTDDGDMYFNEKNNEFKEWGEQWTDEQCEKRTQWLKQDP